MIHEYQQSVYFRGSEGRRVSYRVVDVVSFSRFVIVYDDIDTLADLLPGWTDKQEVGHYRLSRRKDDALFGYAVGPQS